MLKKIICLVLLWSPMLHAWSQRTFGYDCIYTTTFNFKFDRGEDYRTLQSTLLIGDNNSCFFTLPTNKTYEKDDDETNVVIKLDTMLKVTKFTGDNYLLFSDPMIKKNVEYKDTLYPMRWTLENEHKQIDSLNCSKAVAWFKGRTYTAWYCRTLPIPNGPWKLGGLPGLIVEAYDDKKDMYFLLNSIRKTNIDIASDMPDRLDRHPSYDEYMGDRKSFMKEFLERMNTQETGCLDCQTKSKIRFYFWENDAD